MWIKNENKKNDDLKNTVKWAFFEGDFSKFANESSVSSERIKMQKQIKTKKEIVQVTHEFYCDNCGKFLGSSKEWDDGYYKEYGSFKNNLCINSRWYRYRKNLCDKCQNEFVAKLTKTLIELGYTKDR